MTPGKVGGANYANEMGGPGVISFLLYKASKHIYMRHHYNVRLLWPIYNNEHHTKIAILFLYYRGRYKIEL